LIDKKWLLVYDNVDEMEILRPYLPSSGPILITTRYKSEALRAPGATVKRLELETFKLEDAAKVFNTLMLSKKPDAVVDKENTAILLKSIDGLALGIEQMVAYICFRDYTVQEFLEQYQKTTLQVGILKRGDGMAPISQHTLATVWEMHFQHISTTDARTLLGILSMLSPNHIPLKLFLPKEELGNAVKHMSFFDDESL